jgi:hypothetical protein
VSKVPVHSFPLFRLDNVGRGNGLSALRARLFLGHGVRERGRGFKGGKTTTRLFAFISQIPLLSHHGCQGSIHSYRRHTNQPRFVLLSPGPPPCRRRPQKSLLILVSACRVLSCGRVVWRLLRKNRRVCMSTWA